MPDFNNGPGGDSNSYPVLFPSISLSPTRIMAPPWATLILCQMKYASVQVSYLWFLDGYHLAKGPTLDFNNGPGNDFNSSHSLDPRRLFESDSNNGPPQAISVLNCKQKLARKRT